MCVCVLGECVSFGAEKYAIARMTERAIRRVRERKGEKESGALCQWQQKPR